MSRSVFSLLLVSLLCHGARGQEPNASQSLHDVLSTECFSEVSRYDALSDARTDGSSAAWWQSGFVRSGGSWATLDAAVGELAKDRELLEYRRLASTESVETLAKWCLDRNQRDRFRALVQANTPSDQLNARLLKEMGWFHVNGRWVSPENAFKLSKEVNRALASAALWGEQLVQIRHQLSGPAKQAAIAERRLEAIDSPTAVFSIAQVLGSGSPRCQRLAAEALARIPSTESSQLLARYAVLSPLESVRRTATTALSKRPLESFVPFVLSSLTSVKHNVETLNYKIPLDYDPRLPWWNQTFSYGRAEGKRYQTIIETVNQRRVHNTDLTAFFLFLGADAELALGAHNADLRLVGDLIRAHGLQNFRLRDGYVTKAGNKKVRQLTALYAHIPEKAKNESKTIADRFRLMNERGMAVLSSVSGIKADNPQAWWDWWNLHTDVDAPEKKLVEVTEQHVEPFAVAWSCFAAGTQVLTESGRIPIELVRVGDRVASQDIETGELSFRVVRKTTIRPPRPTQIISFGDESIRCTGGHNFWKAGTGWVKARDLEVGDRIRTPTGTEAVTAIAEGEPAKTYNLVVEGFHTYFVGESKLLVQDVMPITPTDNVLPGFSKFELGNDGFREDE